MTARTVPTAADIDAAARALAPAGMWDGDWIFPAEREEYRDSMRARALAALLGEPHQASALRAGRAPSAPGSTPDAGPYDFTAEREDARRATWWRYPQPGQWVRGAWETYEGAAA